MDDDDDVAKKSCSADGKFQAMEGLHGRHMNVWRAPAIWRDVRACVRACARVTKVQMLFPLARITKHCDSSYKGASDEQMLAGAWLTLKDKCSI